MTKTALVTGASSGIGRGIAHKFGQEGWEVTLVARRQENLEKVAKEVAVSYTHLTLPTIYSV